MTLTSDSTYFVRKIKNYDTLYILYGSIVISFCISAMSHKLVSVEVVLKRKC